MTAAVEQLRHVCALGALQSVVAIPRAVPILHAGPGCGAKLWNALATYNAYQGSGYTGGHSIPCTNSCENEVIFGGEDRLREVIDSSFRVMDSDLYVVLTGCTADIVGDDVGGVVKEFQDSGKPVVYTETGGFKGSNLLGHEFVLQAIIEQYLDSSEGIDTGLVNVWSVVPYHDPFWEGSIEAINDLIRSIGLKPNTVFGLHGGVDALNRLPRAQFNLLISPWVGLNTVKLLESRFGTPFLHYPTLPIGPTETGRFLRTVSKFAEMDQDIIEQYIEQQEHRYYHYVERIADFLFESRSAQPTRFVTIADSAYSAGISRFLISDLGLVPEVQFITDDPPEEYRPTIESAFSNIVDGISSRLVFTNDGGVIRETLQDTKFYARPFVIGSAWDRVIAREINGYPLSISMPITDRLIMSRTYVGYEGGLRLLEDLHSTVLGDYQ
jgi:nitrogenase molybdenum-iron protein beta chain